MPKYHLYHSKIKFQNPKFNHAEKEIAVRKCKGLAKLGNIVSCYVSRGG